MFCSAPGIRIKLAGPAMLNVYERDRGTQETRAQGIIATLTAPPDATRGGARVDGSTAKAIARAMEQAGIRPSNRSRRVGDYELGSLLFQGPAYQDYEGTHVALKGVKRRVRLYPIPLGASPSDRETIRRAAQREFQILEGIHHPGLLRALEYKDHERGAALIFEHDPDAIRLDHFVQQNGPRLGVEQRLTLLRQIAETVQVRARKEAGSSRAQPPKHSDFLSFVTAAPSPDSELAVGLPGCDGVNVFDAAPGDGHGASRSSH